MATTVPAEWMDDRFGRADGTRSTGAPTHHITLALSHNRRAFYANMLVERAFWNAQGVYAVARARQVAKGSFGH